MVLPTPLGFGVPHILDLVSAGDENCILKETTAFEQVAAGLNVNTHVSYTPPDNEHAQEHESTISNVSKCINNFV